MSETSILRDRVEAPSLQRLAYTSRRTALMGSHDLADIMQVSARRNKEDGITGAFFTAGDDLLQILEGPPKALEALMKRIKVDDRHTEVKVFAAANTESRAFSSWGMTEIKIDERPEHIRSSFGRLLEIFKMSPVTIPLDDEKVKFFQRMRRWS